MGLQSCKEQGICFGEIFQRCTTAAPAHPADLQFGEPGLVCDSANGGSNRHWQITDMTLSLEEVVRHHFDEQKQRPQEQDANLR